MFFFWYFFFFQAEDGIRDVAVTGVQTCALPISRDSSEEIQLEWPFARDLPRDFARSPGMASWPSSVMADFNVTNGLFVRIQQANGSLRRWASSSQIPVKTSMPAARRRSKPRPELTGFGSSIAATTRRTPAAMIASVQGPLRPV